MLAGILDAFCVRKPSLAKPLSDNCILAHGYSSAAPHGKGWPSSVSWRHIGRFHYRQALNPRTSEKFYLIATAPKPVRAPSVRPWAQRPRISEVVPATLCLTSSLCQHQVFDAACAPGE
eukprot:scaffold83390_cov31-Tisochrysis_lutea.AAC.1